MLVKMTSEQQNVKNNIIFYREKGKKKFKEKKEKNGHQKG
jgi:hypothetical protein